MDFTRPKRKWEFLKIRLEPDDVKLLGQVMLAEKLTRADIIRRAMREYAKRVLVSSDATESKVA